MSFMEYVDRRFFVNGEHADYGQVVDAGNSMHMRMKFWRALALVALAVIILFATPIGEWLLDRGSSLWEDIKSFYTEYTALVIVLLVVLAFVLGYKYRAKIMSHRLTNSAMALPKTATHKVSAGVKKARENARGSTTPSNST